MSSSPRNPKRSRLYDEECMVIDSCVVIDFCGRTDNLELLMHHLCGRGVITVRREG